MVTLTPLILFVTQLKPVSLLRISRAGTIINPLTRSKLYPFHVDSSISLLVISFDSSDLQKLFIIDPNGKYPVELCRADKILTVIDNCRNRCLPSLSTCGISAMNESKFILPETPAPFSHTLFPPPPPPLAKIFNEEHTWFNLKSA